MNELKIDSPPEKSEYAPYYGKYVELVGDADVLSLLESNLAKSMDLLSKITEEKALFRYEEEKWSIKELLGHIIDTERIFMYRALRFARNDGSPLAGFEQDDYIKNADFDSVALPDLISEFQAVRNSTISMFRNFTLQAWSGSGIASENSVSVKALAYLIAGHEIHHIAILRERYLI